MIHSTRRVIGTAAIACAVGSVPLFASPVARSQPHAARAGTSSRRASLVDLAPCNNSPLSQPFVRWGDSASYELVPNGDFETPGWTLTGGAQRVPGSEPYAVTGTLGAYSLSLPAGATAQSPLTCVDAAYPSVRFFIMGSGIVLVSLDDAGLVVPASAAIASGAWQPTPVLLTESPVLATLGGGTALVSVSFTAAAGDPQVDDVFIDPWSRGG